MKTSVCTFVTMAMVLLLGCDRALSIPREGPGASLPEASYKIVDDRGVTFNAEVWDDLQIGVIRIVLSSHNRVVDSLTLSHTDGLDTTTLYMNAFLGVTYRVKLGSGMRQRNTIVAMVVNGKLIRCLGFVSKYTEDVRAVFDENADSLNLFDEHTYYEVQLSIHSMGSVRKSKPRIQCVLSESLDVRSKHDPTTDRKLQNEVVLHYDSRRRIFMNDEVVLNGKYDVFSRAATPDTTLDFVNFKVGSVSLMERRSIYLNGFWYVLGNNLRAL